MSGAPSTQGGVTYDESGRMQEAQPGRKRGGMPGLAAARGGFFGGGGGGGGGAPEQGLANSGDPMDIQQQPRMGKKARKRARREAEAAAAIGPDGQIDPEWASKNPEAAQAKLIDIQREDFNARYRPLEEAAIAEFMKSPEEAAQRAGGIAAQGFHGGTGAADRSMGRMGASMTGDQRRAAGEATGLAQARAVGTAENTTRRAMTDRNIEGIGTMIGIGKGIMGGTNRDMGLAAGMQGQRNAAHSAAKGQHKAGAISGIASGAGMGFAIGGPVGAGIGAAAGGLLSLF